MTDRPTRLCCSPYQWIPMNNSGYWISECPGSKFGCQTSATQIQYLNICLPQIFIWALNTILHNRSYLLVCWLETAGNTPEFQPLLSFYLDTQCRWHINVIWHIGYFCLISALGYKAWFLWTPASRHLTNVLGLCICINILEVNYLVCCSLQHLSL